MALRHVSPFVEEKRPWIERTLRRLREAEEAVPAADLRDGGAVPLLGRILPIKVRFEPGRVRALVRERPAAAGQLELAPAPFGATELHVAVGRRAELRPALERWYRARAREEIADRLDAAVARNGTGYVSLTIRGQRTRWASCSSEGSMSFNWRLLLAPEEILDYVIEHEVTHLEILDHSRRFWRLLASRCPDYREHERWLRRHGAALRL
jgi:predicted metal-dependent hydrolase